MLYIMQFVHTKDHFIIDEIFIILFHMAKVYHTL